MLCILLISRDFDDSGGCFFWRGGGEGGGDQKKHMAFTDVLL